MWFRVRHTQKSLKMVKFEMCRDESVHYTYICMDLWIEDRENPFENSL
jgi:hypothetical protein